MAYLPSHQELRDHPKTRKVARRLGASIPQAIGHLHLLWWWALDHAPDGDVSRYDDEDLADAAMWEGDAAEFVAALTDCGPGDSAGFIDGGRLHDWAEYGGKYGQRVAAAKKAAKARWHAGAPPEECDRNASASEGQCEPGAEGNAEKRREENHPRARARETADPQPVDEASLADRAITAAVEHATTAANGEVKNLKAYRRQVRQSLTDDGTVDRIRDLASRYDRAPPEMLAHAATGGDARNLAHYRTETP